MKLVYGKEGPLFVILLALSIIIWAAVIVASFGIALLYMLIFFVAYLFAHSAYISHIRGTGARISKEQFPDLFERVEAACKKLDMQKVPEAYVLNSNGILNAMATRFLGHDLLVLYSSVLDALEERPEAVSFYIGHELGHIRRNHLLMTPVLAPGRLFPLIGAAYGRAKEYTCDLHGLTCCPQLEDAQRALIVLAAGETRWKNVNVSAYTSQMQITGGFWMSFHELISDYPWLMKRVEHITAMGQNRGYERPSRNFFAWVIAFFVPRVGIAASGASGLVMIAIIGMLAAIAIPAYQDFLSRSQTAEAEALMENGKTALVQYYQENNAWPKDLATAYPAASSSGVGRYTDTLVLLGPSGESLGILVTMKSSGVNPQIAGKTIELWTTDNGASWHCGPGDANPVDPKYLLGNCREQGAP